MVFVGYFTKLSTISAQNLIYDHKLSKEEIPTFEMCGIVLSSSACTMKVCDFYGTIELYKKTNLEISGQGSFVFRVKPYHRNSNLVLYCKEYKKVSIYEEIAFNLEIKALIDDENSVI